MVDVLQALETKLASAFEAGDWTLDASDLTELGHIEESGVRPISMNVHVLGGSRPRT